MSAVLTATGSRTARAAFRHADFRLLATGLAVSQVGSWAYTVALADYVYSATHSAGWLGATAVARFLPYLFALPYGARISARYERTRTMVSVSLVCAALQLGLAANAALDGPVALALGLAALSAVALSAYPPATAATTAALVGQSGLAAASRLTGTVENVAVIGGSALGAVLLLLGDPTSAFLVTAAGFLGAAEVVLRIQGRSRPGTVPADRLADLRQPLAGLRQAAGSAAARTLLGHVVLAGIVFGADTVLLVLVSEFRLGTGPGGFGYLLAALGVGGVLGARLANRLVSQPLRPLGALLPVGTALMALPTAVLVWVHSPVIAVVLEVVRGVGLLAVDVLVVAALHRWLRSTELDRAMGTLYTLVIGSVALGAAVASLLLAAFGLNQVLLVFGLTPVLAAVLTSPKLRQLDRPAADRMAGLAPRVSLLEGLDIFATTPRPAVERLAGAATEIISRAGRLVVREGQPADALYVLTGGEVAVNARGAARRTSRLGTMTAPAYFGQTGLLEGTPQAAAVKTLVPCRLLRIDRDELLAAVANESRPTLPIEGALGRLPRRPAESA